MTRVTLLTLFVAACTGIDPGPGAQTSGPGDPTLPEVWGPPAAEDHDPDPQVVEVHLTADQTDWAYVDQGSARAWAYNDSVPGPLIHLQLGQTLRVVFTNALNESTTIHWHGLRIPDEMDGVPAVQDPVQPGETFTYEFTPPDPGSFWYHPHVRTNVQVERGLQGTLVVHEAEPPAYDEDRYFVLDDIRLDADGSLADINTMGHMDEMHGRHGNVLLVNGQSDPLLADLRRGTRERWRIVNTANARTMWVDVTGADWRVIAVDGTLLPTPIPGDAPALLPVGRRLDLEVVPGDRAPAAKLRVVLPADTGAAPDTYVMFEGALGGDDLAPGFLSPWNVADLPPVRPAEQDVSLDLDSGGAMMSFEWTINGETYDSFTPLRAQAHTPTRIMIQDLSGLPHPFHLHGQFFQIVSRGRLPVTPGLLDTVLVDGDETVELYTELDNPGVWMAHCHILEHAELGMMTELHVEE